MQPIPLERLRQDSAARNGSFAKSRLLRVAFRYPSRARSAWPDDAGLPYQFRRRPTAFMGFHRPFADLIPTAGWTRHIASVAGSEHTVVLAPSAFLPVRAHVPFVPPLPPRFIFVGVTDRLLE